MAAVPACPVLSHPLIRHSRARGSGSVTDGTLVGAAAEDKWRPHVVTRPVVDTAGADLDGIREAVDGCLSRFLDRKACPAAADRLPPEIVETLRDFLSVGKRIRPVLCVMGWRATGGRGPSPAAVVQVAAALEMFHAFALIHDAAPRGRRPTKPSRERSLSSVLLPAGCTGSRGSHAELQRLGRRVNRNRARLPPINLRSCVWGGR